MDLHNIKLPNRTKINKLRKKVWKFVEKEYPNLSYEDKLLYFDGIIDGYLYARSKYKKDK
jgi:hypothetical protein